MQFAIDYQEDAAALRKHGRRESIIASQPFSIASALAKVLLI
jgi:hypothetical protein